jgi:hypothetical protein
MKYVSSTSIFMDVFFCALIKIVLKFAESAPHLTSFIVLSAIVPLYLQLL